MKEHELIKMLGRKPTAFELLINLGMKAITTPMHLKQLEAHHQSWLEKNK